jgi:Tol biopolymer transport system component
VPPTNRFIKYRKILAVLGTALLVLSVAWAWVLYLMPMGATPASHPLESLVIPGELDLYTFSPLSTAGGSVMNGVLKYTSWGGATSLYTQRVTSPLSFVSLSPRRDQLVLGTSPSVSGGDATLTSYSLNTGSSKVLDTGKGASFSLPSWSSDGTKLLYLKGILGKDSKVTASHMVRLSLDTMAVTNLGKGIPIALSPDGSSVLYLGNDTRLYIVNGNAPAKAVSETIQLASTAEERQGIRVAVSPTNQYVALLGDTSVYFARIDWNTSTLTTSISIDGYYASGVYDQDGELLLAHTDGTADLYVPSAGGFQGTTTYLIPKLTPPVTLLGWVKSAQ